MKRIIYLLIPVMVLLVACGNKPINFDNQEEVTKAWSDWDNQSDENKEALLKNAKDQINAHILEAEACQAKEDSVIAIVDAKWVALQDTTDVEAQKVILDEIKEMCKSCCDKESCDKKGCSEEATCAKKETEGCCKEWADWSNLKPERKAELIAMAIENHNAKKAECESKRAECETKKAEFAAKWNDIDSKTIDEQKAIIDEILASCPESCCNKEGKCEKEGKSCEGQESTQE